MTTENQPGAKNLRGVAWCEAMTSFPIHFKGVVEEFSAAAAR